MYHKEDFIAIIDRASFGQALYFWLGICADRRELSIIKQMHPDMPDYLEDCYIWEASKCYALMKLIDPEDFAFRKNGILLGEDVYSYPPYTPGLFLAVLYAISKRDPYGGWETDQILRAKIRDKMEADFPAYLADIDKIINHGWINPDEIESIRTRPILRPYPQRSQATVSKEEESIVIVESQEPKEEPTPADDDMELPPLFSHELQTNKDMRMAFIRVIRDIISPRITSGSSESKWKWKHVQMALYESKHIVKLENKREFGRCMEPLTGQLANNIEGSLKRFTSRPTDANNILAIRKVIDDYIRNNTAPKTNESKSVGEGDRLKPYKESMWRVVKHIASLEEFFKEGCTTDLLERMFANFAETYPAMIEQFDSKSERKILFRVIWILWDVGFIVSNIPCIEQAKVLSKSLGEDVDVNAVNRKLMSADLDKYPEEYKIFFELMQLTFSKFLQSRGLGA